MTSILFRAQAPHRLNYGRYVLHLKSPVTPRTCALPSIPARCFSKSRLYPRDVFSRCLSTDTKAGQDLLRASPSIEDIRLKTEFEENKDIRDYLRKWQEINPNHLDPVRGPETSNSLEPSEPWVGNMLNDNQETSDAGGDSARAIDDDLSDFTHIADEGEGIHDFLEPGDLVALSSSEGVLRFAIYVRSVFKQQQFYTERGKWRIAFPKDLDFVVKGFAPPESVESLHPYFPESMAQMSTEMQSAIEGGVPRSVGASLVQMMYTFSAQVQEIYRANCIRLDKIHEIVADEEVALEFTLEELACKALEIEEDQLNHVILYVVHQAVRRNSFIMESDGSSLFTNHYVIKPMRTATVLKTVTTWVHEHQDLLTKAMAGAELLGIRDHPLHQFIQKAQRLIKFSRKVRSPTTMASVGPTAQRFRPGQDDRPAVYREVLTEKFNSKDRMIIEFLQLWCIPPRRMTSGILRSAGSHIMQATGMYTTLELTAGTAPLFLQELGVFLPWENLQLLDPELSLPGHGISPRADAAWEEVQQECKKHEKDGLIDKMEGMRTDWGDMTIYCIDNPDAEEIDDGVSLEHVAESTFWVHIHIANPSAFIPPEDLLMKYAASRVQTLYTPERTYPMLPSSLTRGHFSLAPGRPTLTFSAKMDLKGTIFETKISSGIARKVVYLTHDKLRSFFKLAKDEPLQPLTVGGELPRPADSRTNLLESLTSEDKTTFNTLRRLMITFHERRRENGAMEWPPPVDTSVSVSVGTTPLQPSTLDVTTGRYVIGDPIIQLRPQTINPHEIPDLTRHNLVAILMNFGCWISAQWCAKRNIPVVYDGTYYHPEYPHLTNKNISSYGGDTWLQLGAPKGVSSSRPIAHIPLGLDSYVKSTSPLRRYTDLLAHQQIEAALRFEHAHNGTHLLNADKPSDAAVLPFSHDDVETYITRSRWKRNRLRSCDRGSKQFWACMLLFRGFYFNECELPEMFECLIHKPYSQTSMAGTQHGHGFSGVITSLGVRCQILTPPGMDGVNILSVVEARITSVDLSRMLVSMEAVRLVKPYERVGEWAQI